MGMNQALLERAAQLLAEKVSAEYKHDLPAGFTLSTNLMHGPVGIFGTAGADRDVFSTRVTARGLLAELPAMPSVDTNPIVYYLTGFTDESGDEPDAPCETCVKAGNIKSCRQGSIFGMICRDTDELDISNIGRRVNRGEMFDLRMVNDPLLNASPAWVPPSVPKSFQTAINREVLARWLTLGAAFEAKLAGMVWTGNPANNVGTGYAEYLGLESLVTTGHTDVIDQTSCPSLDSDIKDLNYKSVENDAAEIFWTITMGTRYVRHNAEMMRFMPVQWAFVMKDSLFRKLADYWPCVYASARCNATANDITSNVDGMRMKAMSDEMYINRFLEIDGVRYPVILDDAIPYEYNGVNGDLPSGTFASDIYLLPFTVRGGTRVLFMEFFDYSGGGMVGGTSTMQGIADGRLGNEYWTDGGRWLWTFSRTRWCVNWTAKIEPRLRLLTPHLAARFENIQWTPIQAFREPFPDQQYFVDGGLTTGSNAPYDLTDRQ